ncbi:MAG: putative hydroxymethylpyrimidine transporter CytX, partial [Oscillospiraceae bacterium]
FENFLYLIGSVFAPMIAIQIVDFFILKKDSFNKQFDVKNLVIWAVGFALYRAFMRLDTPVGNTLPVMLIVGVICIATHFIAKKFTKKAEIVK